jgi:hypothetical protein
VSANDKRLYWVDERLHPQKDGVKKLKPARRQRYPSAYSHPARPWIDGDIELSARSRFICDLHRLARRRVRRVRLRTAGPCYGG